MNYIIEPEKTAISNGVSKSCKYLVACYNDGIVLDYGFGRLRNSKYIVENSIQLDILDTEVQIAKNALEIKKIGVMNVYSSKHLLDEGKYSQILLSFVLNVIPEKSERIKILGNINHGLKEGGLLYIEVRDYGFVNKVKNKEAYKDGLLIGSGKKRTFQKPYSLDDISEFVLKNGFEILKSTKTSGSVILICTKKNKA